MAVRETCASSAFAPCEATIQDGTEEAQTYRSTSKTQPVTPHAPTASLCLTSQTPTLKSITLTPLLREAPRRRAALHRRLSRSRTASFRP